MRTGKTKRGLEANAEPDLSRLKGECYRYEVSAERPILAFWPRTKTHCHRTPHHDVHYALEMGVVLTGSMLRYYEGTPTPLKLEVGDVWFCGMWEPHGYRITKAPCRALVFTIWPPFLLKMRLPEAPSLRWNAPFVLPPLERPRVADAVRNSVLKRAMSIVRQMPYDSEFKAVQLRFDTLQLIFSILKSAGSTGEPEPARPCPPLSIPAAIDMAFDSSRLVTNEEGARACGMSTDSFIRTFKSMMGVSFTKFALQHRLGDATRLLAAQDVPVKIIAANLGFSDESHFCRVFRKHYGCTPLAYRTQSLTNPKLRVPDPL